MRAVRIHKFGGGPRDLVYEENVLQPHPKEGEVLVKVYAGIVLAFVYNLCHYASFSNKLYLINKIKAKL